MPIAQKVAHIFGPGGSLVQSGFEPRTGQRQMAALVAEAVDQGGWTAVEAPTGSGKSFAHLIPSILGILEARADADPGEKPPRLIVSTANLALQDQLVQKDIPTVARILGVALNVAQLKSVSNYPCWLKVNETLGTIDYSGEQDEIMSLSEWMEDGGDLAKKDKDAVPFNLSPRIWPKVSTDREGCVGEKCPHYAPVPAEGSLLPTSLPVRGRAAGIRPRAHPGHEPRLPRAGVQGVPAGRVAPRHRRGARARRRAPVRTGPGDPRRARQGDHGRGEGAAREHLPPGHVTHRTAPGRS